MNHKTRIKIVYDQLVRWRDQAQAQIDSNNTLYTGVIAEKRDVYDWLASQLKPIVEAATCDKNQD